MHLVIWTIRQITNLSLLLLLTRYWYLIDLPLADLLLTTLTKWLLRYQLLLTISEILRLQLRKTRTQFKYTIHQISAAINLPLSNLLLTNLLRPFLLLLTILPPLHLLLTQNWWLIFLPRSNLLLTTFHNLLLLAILPPLHLLLTRNWWLIFLPRSNLLLTTFHDLLLLAILPLLQLLLSLENPLCLTVHIEALYQ
uniref:Uncharacterized protein n=1 Tax=Anopheles atroparvus TaxID=41427 RepID=A0A182J5Q1_ANOAO